MMAEGQRAPALLLVAAAGMVVQDLVFFAIGSITALSAASLGLAVFLAWLLLHGSRIAWVLVTLSAAAQVVGPLTMNQSVWLAGSGVVLLVLLFSPSSRKFVWTEGSQAAGPSWHEVADKLSGGLWELVARGVSRVLKAVGLPSRGVLICLLAACVAVLLPLDGALRHLHESSDSGNVLLDVLYRVVAIADGLAQIALIMTIIITTYHYLINRITSNGARVAERQTGMQVGAKNGVGEDTQLPYLREYSDLDRPKGWYVDPIEPSKMHHWGGKNSPEWVGTTRTPRKMLQAWLAQQE